MVHAPLSTSERRKLVEALKSNAEQGTAILMSRKDTSFISTAQEVPDCEVIEAIKSTPCHY